MTKKLRAAGITKTTLVGYLQLSFGIVQLISASPVIPEKYAGLFLSLSGAFVIIFRILGLPDGQDEVPPVGPSAKEEVASVLPHQSSNPTNA